MATLPNLGALPFSRIESNLTKDKVVNSSRCIIYAAPYKSNDLSTISQQTFKKIGVVQGYSFAEQRQIDMIFELGSELPYLIPGRTTGQLSLSRVLLFGSDLINVLYDNTGSTVKFTSIKDINYPLELMFAGYDASGNPAFSRVFSECWIQSRSENITAGQVVVAENVNIMYTNISSYNAVTTAQAPT